MHQEDFKTMDDKNRKSIIRQVKKYKNSLVLFSFEVCELLDWVDGEDDYYWVVNTNREIIWRSCVGGFISLIDYLPKNLYDGLKKTWDYNDSFKWDGGERLKQIKMNNWIDEEYRSRMEKEYENSVLKEIFNKDE